MIASLDNDDDHCRRLCLFRLMKREKKAVFFLLLILDETSELYDELCLYSYILIMTL